MIIINKSSHIAQAPGGLLMAVSLLQVPPSLVQDSEVSHARRHAYLAYTCKYQN